MLTISDILEKKKRGEKIVMLTAYDFPVAFYLDACGIDIILVGDSLANVVLGLESTREVDMGVMLHHAKAVTRAVKRAVVVGDMPYSSLQASPEKVLSDARRFMVEGGCGAIKIEWFDGCPQVVGLLVNDGIPVMGHVGLTPQTAEALGGFKVQGRDSQAAIRIFHQARQLAEKGCFALVLECVPDRLAEYITGKLTIPTLGIGAGSGCDGQVLVSYDILGLFERYRPKFVKLYATLGQEIKNGASRFREEVRSGRFPDAQYSYSMKDEEFKKFLEAMK